jgi:hypothetical protein
MCETCARCVRSKIGATVIVVELKIVGGLKFADNPEAG